MRKKLEKLIVMVSILMFFVVSMGPKEVHAIDNSEWDIKINQIGDAKRCYFNNSFTFLAENMKKSSASTDVYNINTKEVAIQAERINQAAHIYVSVDDKFIGYADQNLIDYAGDSSKSFTTFVVKNLTPGQHKIEIKADDPNYMSVEQKTDVVYVNMLSYSDENVEKSIENIKNGNAKIIDYIIVGIDEYTITDINWLNEKMKDKNINASNVQETINNILKQKGDEDQQKAILSKINAGTAVLSDYSTFGIQGVTSSNLNNVNGVIKITRDEKNQDLTKEEIQEIVNQIPSKIDGANTRINNGQGTVLDYTLLGINYVTEENLEDINWYVKGKDNSTISKLQSNVTIMKNALYSANLGSTSSWATLGITTVNSNNSAAVATALKTARSKKGSNLTRTEIVKVVEGALGDVSEINVRINAGEGTVADYALLGINYVTEENLEDINWYVKGKDNSTTTKLQRNVTLMKNGLYYANIGTTSSLTTLGITTVNSNNSAAVSTALKTARSKKGSNLTRTEIVEVVNEAIKPKINNINLMMIEDKKILETKGDSLILEEKNHNSEIHMNLSQDEKKLNDEEQAKNNSVVEDKANNNKNNKMEENDAKHDENLNEKNQVQNNKVVENKAEDSNGFKLHQKEEVDKPVDIKEDNTNNNSQDTKIEKNDAGKLITKDIAA